MKYFIDFEATQFSQEIISIGCVREDGESFYSLIKPKKLSGITDFITSLTGITKDMVREAPNSDEVFKNFFTWLSNSEGVAEFYCYGNSDFNFLQKNLKDRTNNLFAQAALSIIGMNLKDYSSDVKNHFGLIKNISLKKVFNYFYPNEECNLHNALSDAEMLYKVYSSIVKKQEIVGIPFPDYIGEPIFETNDDFANYDILVNNTIYETFEEALDFAISILRNNNQPKFRKENIQRKIIHAINCKKEYFGLKWKVLRKGMQVSEDINYGSK